MADNVEAAKERLRKVYSTHWDSRSINTPDVDLLLASHDDLTEQLAEARAALRCVPSDPNSPLIADELQTRLTEAELFGDTLERINSETLQLIGNIAAERDRLQRDLAVVTIELEAMNANHRVMAGELADMVRERDALNKELALWQDTFCLEHAGQDFQDECGVCFLENRLIQLECNLAALSTPKCVNGCEAKFWVEADQYFEKGKPAVHLSFCERCLVFTQGQDKMREAVVAKVSELGDVEGFIDVPTSIVIEDIRALPVTGLADGKQ